MEQAKGGQWIIHVMGDDGHTGVGRKAVMERCQHGCGEIQCDEVRFWACHTQQPEKPASSASKIQDALRAGGRNSSSAASPSTRCGMESARRRYSRACSAVVHRLMLGWALILRLSYSYRDEVQHTGRGLSSARLSQNNSQGDSCAS